MMDYDPEHSERVERRTRQSRETGLFGNTVETMRADFVAVLGEPEGADQIEVGKIVLSMLSDAQEMIRMKLYEQARQGINRAKWVLFEYVANRKVVSLTIVGGDHESKGNGESPAGDSQ